MERPREQPTLLRESYRLAGTLVSMPIISVFFGIIDSDVL